MYKQIRLTVHEAFEQTSILHKTWDKGSFNYRTFTWTLGDIKEAQPNAELAIFISGDDLNTIITDSKFADIFDAVSQKEIMEYGYLGSLAGVYAYRSSSSTQLRERKKSLTMTEILKVVTEERVELPT